MHFFQDPVLLECSGDRNEREQSAMTSKVPRIEVDEGHLLGESNSVGQRTFNSDSRNLIDEINATIAAHARDGSPMDFKTSVKLIHTLFEAAAAVATVAQMDNPRDQKEDLDALHDHAVAGMALIDLKQPRGH